MEKFYGQTLQAYHLALIHHDVAVRHLSGEDLRLDGARLQPEDQVEIFPGVSLDTLGFAHLFGVFNGSRVHRQRESRTSLDDAPPGLYYTVIHTHLIQNQHKNRIGIAQTEGGLDMFVGEMFVDHIFLNGRKTPPLLGTITFALSAITAFLLGIRWIELIAAGGVGYSRAHHGFKVWPKLGFDAPVEVEEVAGAPNLAHCRTVQEVLAIDPTWWEGNGSQRLMRFDLAADSRSWRKLLCYLDSKGEF
jgi:hypothetical protein